MDSIPEPVKIAAVTAGAAYLLAKELDNRLSVGADITMLRKMLPYRKQVTKGFKEQKTVTDFWYETLSKLASSKPAIVFPEESRTWTFGDLEAYSNRVANFFISQGIKEDDTIALFMENRPEFIGTWLGATKVSCIRGDCISYIR
jgi:non-ribosomal peptide synthetase component E (peptide arylation enzyme)